MLTEFPSKQNSRRKNYDIFECTGLDNFTRKLYHRYDFHFHPRSASVPHPINILPSHFPLAFFLAPFHCRHLTAARNHSVRLNRIFVFPKRKIVRLYRICIKNGSCLVVRVGGAEGGRENLQSFSAAKFPSFCFVFSVAWDSGN